MDKHYDFREFEARLVAQWQAYSKPGAEPYIITMPPPNVTGSLHLGHALSSTLQDILIRFHRMRGYDVLWVPGLDHAGIATQMMVEKELAKEGKTRYDLGRENFLERVWAWKDKYGHIIVDQMKRMGFSANWSYLKFTLDSSISLAVNQAFCRLYQKGLIYRAQRLVNWDPHLSTAISDLEVINKIEKGSLWTLRYPIDGQESAYIEVATTRPETLFGDQAVAVHPNDERYRDLIGCHVRVPVSGQLVPVITDQAVDPEKGTGAVKVTPGHDFLDFEIGQRHGLRPVTIFDEQARLCVAGKFQGLERFEARKKVLEALALEGYLVKEETIEHTVPYSERSGVPIEPCLTLQWFVDTQEMAEKALQAVKQSRTSFVPSEWANNYFEWLKEIRPWCVSRQLWWGHRIPAWYGPEGRIFVAPTQVEAQKMAVEDFGKEVPLFQDEDVLDTWFSSALWPFTTLGWPEKTSLMERYYPTNVLITGFDIIFFWVARMMMMGLEMTDQVPFHHVYIHPLIQDDQGKKMSKTKQNVINPLEVMEQYGTDALRFSLVMSCSGKRHMRFGLSHAEYARNFMTKIWNVSRFLFLKGITIQHVQPSLVQPVNQWLAKELKDLVAKVTEGLTQYKFHEVASLLYHFVWHIFCDRFIELSKDSLSDSSQGESGQVAGWALGVLLRLLHPFIPFITEKLWEVMAKKQNLYLEEWPYLEDISESILQEADHAAWLVEVMNAVRRLRATFSLSPSLPLEVSLYDLGSEQKAFLETQEKTLMRLLSLSRLKGEEQSPPYNGQGAYLPIQQATLVVPLAHIMDLEAEKARLAKEIIQGEKEVQDLTLRLANPDFRTRAPEEVIDSLEQRLGESQARLGHLKRALASLS